MPQVIETSEKKIDTSYIQFVHFKDLTYWDFNTYFRTQKNNYHYPAVKLEEVISQRKWSITIDDDIKYKRPTVKLYGGWVFLRDEVLWKDIKVKRQQICRANDLLVAEIDAKVWGFGIIPDYLEGAIVSSHYFLFEVDTSRLDLEYIGIYIKTAEFQKQVQATWSTNYAAIRPHHFLGYTIPLPDIATQKRIVSEYYAKIDEANRLDTLVIEKEKEIENYLMETLGITIDNAEKKVGLNFLRFKNLERWDIKNENKVSYNTKYPSIELRNIIKMSSGNFLPTKNQKQWEYKIYWGNWLTGTHNETNKEWERIIIWRVWEKCWNIHLVSGKYWVTDNAFWTEKISSDFSWEFLAITLQTINLNRLKIVSAQPSISQKIILDIKIPLVPIEEQNSIIYLVESLKKSISKYREKSESLKQEAKVSFEKELFS